MKVSIRRYIACETLIAASCPLMLPNLKSGTDGSVTLYIQKDSPGSGKESNWLPVPAGPLYFVMRLYWPKETPPSILPIGKGTWQPPAIVKAN